MKLSRFSKRLSGLKPLLAALTVVVSIAPLEPMHAVERELRIAVDALPPFLGHPFASTARPTVFTTSAIYEGLIRFDINGNMNPLLAVSWKNLDELTWRFTLRDGVKFSNGSRLTSESIETAVQWLTSDASLRDGVRGEIPFLRDVQIVDERTADIVTAFPVPNMPRYAGSLIIVEPDLFRSLGRQAYAENPVGTGPFQVSNWGATTIKMEANPYAWRVPQVDQVEIVALPSISGRVQALLSGRVDVATGLGPDERQPIEAGGAVVQTWLDPSVAAITFVTVHGGPLSDPLVRQALNYGVNKEQIIDTFFGGLTSPATQGVSHQAFGFNPDLKPYPFDPDKARRLLADAGYPDGFTFIFLTQSGLGSGALVFQQVASDLSRIGVEMIIRQLPAAAYFDAVLRDPDHGNADAHATIWPAWPIFDAMRPLLMHSCLRPTPWHCDEAIQPKINEALEEWDENRGLGLRRELMAYTRDSAPAIFLYESPEFVGLSRRVKNYRQLHGIIAYDEIRLLD